MHFSRLGMTFSFIHWNPLRFNSGGGGLKGSSFGGSFALSRLRKRANAMHEWPV